MPEPDATFAAWRERADAALQVALPPATRSPGHLHAAMRHAVLNGGKRMRPLLVYATGTLLDADDDLLDAAAVAVELIHAYSLVHDDLPAMDDDNLRRGQPTLHVAYDEATAILAGDALQSLAFERLVRATGSAETRLRMLGELAAAAGSGGMCGGQALDIAATEKWQDGLPSVHTNTNDIPVAQTFSLEQLQHLHALKTGALLRASVRMGAIAGAADARSSTELDRFADALGLAFQIRDDLLDIEASSATLGKTAGKDAAQGKATFPALIGVEASHQRLQQLAEMMDHALASFGPRADLLARLADYVIRRDR